MTKDCTNSIKKLSATTYAFEKGIGMSKARHVLNANRTTYYNSLKKTNKEVSDATVSGIIETIQKKYAFTIGRRRMTTLLDKLTVSG